MTPAAISRQDRPRRLSVKAKAERDGRVWGRYVHVSQLETRRAADALAPQNDGAPGLDGVTVEARAAAGVAALLAPRRDDRVSRTDRPVRHRSVEMLQDGGPRGRVLGMPPIRDRVVQGALTHILAPLVAADGHDGSYGYRPQRTAPQAVDRGAEASVRPKTRVLDAELAAYVDRVRPARLLAKVARRVTDRDIWHVWTLRLKAAGTRGGPQGGVGSPLRSNSDLTAGEARLEEAKAGTATGPPTDVEDARDAEDLGRLVSQDRRQDGLVKAGTQRRRDALATLEGRLHEAKRRSVARRRGESGGVLGCDCRRRRALRGWWRALKEVCRRARAQPVEELIAEINPTLRGGVHDCRMGHASRGCAMVRRWVARKVRRHVRRARKRRGFGGKRWRTAWRDDTLGVCADDRGRDRSRA
jgi:RNA-directed DNA polymerase